MRGDSEYEDELFGYQGEGGGGGPGEEEEAGGLLVTTHTGQVCHCIWDSDGLGQQEDRCMLNISTGEILIFALENHKLGNDLTILWDENAIINTSCNVCIKCCKNNGLRGYIR